MRSYGDDMQSNSTIAAAAATTTTIAEHIIFHTKTPTVNMRKELTGDWLTHWAAHIVQSLSPTKPLCSMINSSLFAESHDTDHRMHIIDFLISSRFVCSSI